MNISVVSVVSDKTILHSVSKISVVSVVGDEIIYYIAIPGYWKSALSANSVMGLAFMLSFMSVVRVDTKDCFLCAVLQNSVVSVVNNESES